MAGAYVQPLEMVRLAPSAKNAQPWRVRKTPNAYHFYADYKPGLSKGEKVIKQVDLGIALSHFHQTVLKLGLAGAFEQMPQEDANLPENIHYMISPFLTLYKLYSKLGKSIFSVPVNIT